MHNIQTMLRLKIGNTEYLHYTHAMECLGLSVHEHQLRRRMRQYHAQFVQYEGEPYISVELAVTLQCYHTAMRQLLILKKGGNHA